MTEILALVAVAAVSIQSGRWLRVAQREHYLPAVSRFAFRWWSSTPANRVLGLIALGTAIGAVVEPGLIVATAIVTASAPIGLGIRGRTSSLVWTRRMRATSAVALVVVTLLVASVVVADTPGALGLVLVTVPAIVDIALVVWRPVQARLDRRWVDQAREGLARSGARVVAITGSYGKTTTKGHLAHLLAGVTAVTASPASFNNRMGLARAVNEHLSSGTDVFIAEMGIYGPGEIAEMCSWIPPEVAVLTALGPVHLERMGTLEAIAEAKREIFGPASVGVISIDHPILRGIAEEEKRLRRMLTVSATGLDADVAGDPTTGAISVDGVEVGSVDPSAIAVSNAACAVAAVLALGFEVDRLSERLTTLPKPPHRQVVSTAPSGLTIIDDTFNSNPAGAARALRLLAGIPARRRVVVTPGMVELGPIQTDENESFAREAAAIADDVVVVGRTNRRALMRGARSDGGAAVHSVDTRDDAVAWVRSELGDGDAVLYENDLPDHYP